MSDERAVFERLKTQLAARGFELTDIPVASAAGAGAGNLDVSASARHRVRSAGHGVLDVMIPVALSLSLDAQGDIASVKGGKPTPDEISAAETWLGDLIANHELDDADAGAPQPRATHQVVRLADGSRIVRRRGFKGAASGG